MSYGVAAVEEEVAATKVAMPAAAVAVADRFVKVCF
jgi:hypothetical protein